jgi:hypothetical protein
MSSPSTGEVGSATASVKASSTTTAVKTSAATTTAVKTSAATTAAVSSALCKCRIRRQSYCHNCKE